MAGGAGDEGKTFAQREYSLQKSRKSHKSQGQLLTCDFKYNGKSRPSPGRFPIPADIAAKSVRISLVPPCFKAKSATHRFVKCCGFTDTETTDTRNGLKKKILSAKGRLVHAG
jgi:hypothetical protein